MQSPAHLFSLNASEEDKEFVQKCQQWSNAILDYYAIFQTPNFKIFQNTLTNNKDLKIINDFCKLASRLTECWKEFYPLALQHPVPHQLHQIKTNIIGILCLHANKKLSDWPRIKELKKHYDNAMLEQKSTYQPPDVWSKAKPHDLVKPTSFVVKRKATGDGSPAAKRPRFRPQIVGTAIGINANPVGAQSSLPRLR